MVISDDLIRLYTKDHLTLAEIGARIGMSRAGVWNRLKQAGIRAEQSEWVEWHCAYCGVPMRVRRKRWRTRQRLHCSTEHYYAALENPTLVLSPRGTRLARAIVSQHFPLQPEHRVHHIDADQTHNDLANLEVYASSGDHHANHRGKQIPPIWKGSSHRQ